MLRRLFSFQAIYVYAFLVIVASIIPVKLHQKSGFPSDKIAHFFIYLIFSFLVANTLANKNYAHYRLKGIFYAFTIGLIIEIVQLFLPYRSFEMLDILANFLGAISGSLILIRYEKYH